MTKKRGELVNKRKIILSVLCIMLVFSISLIVFNREDKTILTDNDLSIYLETEANSGEYTLSELTSIPDSGYELNTEKSECSNGGTLSWDSNSKTVSLSSSREDKCTLYFNIKLSESEKTLAALGLTAKEGNPDFNTKATTDETADGLYAMEDDYGTSYYFRGAVENNYVYFAGYYWRIIRINGDGSLRIIYDGTSAHENGESSTNRLVSTSVAYNSSYNDNAYVGYMYGTTGSSSYEETHANTNNSTIKTYIDNWYKTNIVDKGYAEAVSDEIFCNDREVSTADSSYTGDGTGTTKTSYKARERLDTNKSPQLTCTQKNDAFTVSDEEKGNGDLTYPVGLITADEIALAGGKYNTTNSSYYLYKGSYYWSASPFDFYGDATVFGVYNIGYLGDNGVDFTNGVAPVINLSADYCQQLGGIGSIEDPYTVG